MKTCAQHPIQGDFSLCGMAEDAPETEHDCEPFDFAYARGQRVDCPECLKAIAFIYEIYTPKGKVK